MRGAFHLFVYGTLKSGSAPAAVRGLLREAERVRAAVIRGTLFDVGDYPALLLSGDHEVRGEIWRCPADLLPVLDQYEGTDDGLFRRVAIEVDGTACWVYVAGPRLGPRLTQESRVTGDEWRRPDADPEEPLDP